MSRSRRPSAPTLAFLALFAAAPLAPVAAQGRTGASIPWTPVAAGYPRTASEVSAFSTHTRHVEMWEYLRALRGVSTEMRLGSYGQTRQGRELPYAVFSRPLVNDPDEARALGRPIVVLAANVHGGERTFREGLLILMRDLVTPGTEANALLDDLVIVVAPQINPDGFEASEQGQRGNAWGIDLNRDYVKLEHPATANLVANVLAAWRPHLFIDGHDGGSRPYNLNYQCPSHYDSMRELTLICDREIFPAIDARLSSEGYRSWYYQQGGENEWRTGGFQVRIGRNYAGMMNSIGMLFEAPRQELQGGARAGYLGYLTAIGFVAEHAERVMALVDRARDETVAMGAEPRGSVAVTMEYAPEEYSVDYLLLRGNGSREDTVTVRGARLMKRPVATRFRPRPWAYVLPRDAVDAVAMLRRHGITVERLEAPALLHVDAYTVAGASYESAYNHAAALRIEVGDVVQLERDFPAGTYVVPTAQHLGRLAAHMLEPETDDNVIYWNTMDAWIPRPALGPSAAPLTNGQSSPAAGAGAGVALGGPPLVPIFKLMRPVALASELVQ